jgi:hypothetical protein
MLQDRFRGILIQTIPVHQLAPQYLGVDTINLPAVSVQVPDDGIEGDILLDEVPITSVADDMIVETPLPDDVVMWFESAGFTGYRGLERPDDGGQGSHRNMLERRTP